jgi:hypothetical protein
VDYEGFFKERLDALCAEGRYRVFGDRERRCGRFPRAYDHRVGAEVTVWCSNDYLGMGQHPAVLSAIQETLRAVGAGAGAIRNISGNSHVGGEGRYRIFCRSRTALRPLSARLRWSRPFSARLRSCSTAHSMTTGFASSFIVEVAVVCALAFVLMIPWEATRRKPTVDVRMVETRQFGACFLTMLATGGILLSPASPPARPGAVPWRGNRSSTRRSPRRRGGDRS